MYKEALPKYKDTSLGNSKTRDTATKGAAITDTTKGPRKVRGTTPGNSRWSYCRLFKQDIKRGMERKWHKMFYTSWMSVWW